MEENTQSDIRKLLKTFGVKADQVIRAHLERNPDVAVIQLRLVLQDLTAYSQEPAEPLHIEVEGEVRRGS